MDVDAAVKEIKITGSIQRIGWDIVPNGKQYYFMLAGKKDIFTSTGSIIALTQVNDSVRITYMSNSKGVVPVTSLFNVTIGK